MMALMMVVTMSQCKPDNGNEENNHDGQKLRVSCTIPINNGAKSDFSNIMTNGLIKWSQGVERIYLAIPNENYPQIVELVSPNTKKESDILTFSGEVQKGFITAGEYEIWYLGNSKNLDLPYITETKDHNNIITSISGSIAKQSGNLSDLGYCHIAKTTVTATIENDEVVLSLNGTLKTQIAIAHLDLTDVTQLNGQAIVGTEYSLQYNESKQSFEFVVTPNAEAKITVTEGTNASYVVLFPNATDNVNLKSDKSKKITFKDGVEANNVYYAYISNMEHQPLTWEDYDVNANGYEYVDLGLPSGLLWATRNLGAMSPEEYGCYYAWGETTPKTEYTEVNSIVGNPTVGKLKTNGFIDDSDNLILTYDAARFNWGGDWRLPTSEEFQELVHNCTLELITTSDGVKGCKFTSKENGKYIFLPAAGNCFENEISEDNKYCYYWSSSVFGYNDEGINAVARIFYCSESVINSDDLHEYDECLFVFFAPFFIGQSIRPVMSNP